MTANPKLLASLSNLISLLDGPQSSQALDAALSEARARIEGAQVDYWRTRASRAEMMLEASVESRAHYLRGQGKHYEADRLLGANIVPAGAISRLPGLTQVHDVSENLFELLRDWAATPEGARAGAAQKIIDCVNRSFSQGLVDGINSVKNCHLGWQWVPSAPTPEMRAAAESKLGFIGQYTAAVAAAPSAATALQLDQA